MTTGAISAVIPCHNAAPFLAAAIASVRAQSRAVAELIVVDDASTDGSGAIAERLGATVIRLPTQSGSGAARNAGLRAARNELVGMVDADDVWLSNHCERLAGLLDRFPDACAAFGAMRLIGDAEGVYRPLLAESTPQWAFDLCLETWIGMTSCVIRRSAALAVGGFDETMAVGVDFDMWLRLAPHHPFIATQEITGLYRHHGGQISRRRVLQAEMCFRSRRRAWEGLVAAGDAAAAEHAAIIIRRAYQTALQNAWDERDRETLRAVLAFADLVPGAEALRRTWTRRLAIPAPLVSVWTGLGEGVRQPVRRVLHWFEQRAAAPRER